MRRATRAREDNARFATTQREGGRVTMKTDKGRHSLKVEWTVVIGSSLSSLTLNVWHAAQKLAELAAKHDPTLANKSLATGQVILALIGGVLPVFLAVLMPEVGKGLEQTPWAKTVTYLVFAGAIGMSVQAQAAMVKPFLGEPLCYVFPATVDLALIRAVQVILRVRAERAAAKHGGSLLVRKYDRSGGVPAAPEELTETPRPALTGEAPASLAGFTGEVHPAPAGEVPGSPVTFTGEPAVTLTPDGSVTLTGEVHPAPAGEVPTASASEVPAVPEPAPVNPPKPEPAPAPALPKSVADRPKPARNNGRKRPVKKSVTVDPSELSNDELVEYIDEKFQGGLISANSIRMAHLPMGTPKATKIYLRYLVAKGLPLPEKYAGVNLAELIGEPSSGVTETLTGEGADELTG
ncbi:hypothetical protein [Microbispora sp. NPDC049125]|uniref:hypothetical protein n=1 Tax=Microbispora sp. NPDC049125 TaxID=3154929 RepID=UPI0034679482